ncbi:MAG: hypothetical protein LWX07_10630 [Bacteroidetes bacterium]|nr:hypothetical protein [Bacteroidota bacterium]
MYEILRSMKNIILSFVFYVLFVLAIAGCSSSKQSNEYVIRLYGIDSTLFVNYYKLWFPSNYSDADTSGFIVLSGKNANGDTDLRDYELMNVGDTYGIKLFTVDSLVSAKLLRLNFIGDLDSYIIDPGIVFWRKGKIMVKVYFSQDLKGRYVLKGKRIEKK